MPCTNSLGQFTLLTLLKRLFALVKLHITIFTFPRKSGAFFILNENHCRFPEPLESDLINT